MKIIFITALLTCILSCADVQNQGARVAENAGGVVREIGKDAWKVPPRAEGTTCQPAATKCSKCNGGCGQ